MSQVLSGEQSVDAPSRYTLFERDVFGASSPKRPRRLSMSKKPNKATKFKRFSEVAFAGESPNLKDVSSCNLSKSKNSVLVLSAEKGVQSPTSRQTSLLLFESPEGSSTPSLQVGTRHVTEVHSENVRPTSSKPSPSKDTPDLLTTESFTEPSAVVNGQPNVLRIDSTPDTALPDGVGRLSHNQQIELSVRKARDWLNSIPNDIETLEPVETHDDSLISTISRRSDLPAQHSQSQDSVLIVAPGANVREVRILLQRLDPQLLLKVPIKDIQNLMKTPSNLTMTQVQKTMNSLLTSKKIGLTTIDKRLMKSIECNTVSKISNVRAPELQSPKKKKTQVKTRMLYTGQRQSTDLPVEINLPSENVKVHCPYTPPGRGRSRKKHCLPVKKKMPSKLPTTNNPKKSPHPRQKKSLKSKVPVDNQLKVGRRTRSSDLPKLPTSSEKIQRKPCTETNPESNLATTSKRKRSHEMTLRKKSNPRRTSLFFQSKNKVPKPKRATKRNSGSQKNHPKVVCTFLHRGEVETVACVLKKLGGQMENKVSEGTTHVVCGGPKRTINFLKGIARGCWLVTLDWVVQSQENQCWVDEEPYEITNFSSAVQKCRIAKQTLGIYPTIFEKVGAVYVAAKTSPPKAELSELLKLCGAKLVKTTRRATVAVGIMVAGLTSVSEVWVLDSIQENTVLPFQQYLLNN